MNAVINEIFKFYSPNFEKLNEFGFKKVDKHFCYETEILSGQFLLTVKIFENGEITTKLVDRDLNEEYVLHLMDGAGGFALKVLAEFEKVLIDIREQCFYKDVFKSHGAKLLIDYASKNYGDALEFLWEKFPDTAILRRKDNKKWYAAFMIIKKSKLGVETDEVADIVDVRIEPDCLEKVIDGKTYFPGYHMNKKHWLTICLDGSVKNSQLIEFLENSYLLAKK